LPLKIQIGGKMWTTFYSEIDFKNILVNIKLKFTLEQATKAQRWSRGTAPLFV
jgi:hypothetical protein